MTVKEAIEQFRIILHDVSEEYDDYHAVMRLNSAVQLISALLVQINSPLVIQSAVLHNGGQLLQDESFGVHRDKSECHGRLYPCKA